MSMGLLVQNPSSGASFNDTTNVVKYVYKNEHILAGDFVQYITGRESVTDYGTSTTTSLYGNESYTAKGFRTFKLNDTDTLILTGITSSIVLRATIVRTNGKESTIIFTKDISSISYAINTIHDIIRLNNGDLLVLHDGSGYLYATILWYADDAVGDKQTIRVCTDSYSGGRAGIGMIRDSYVWILHKYSSAAYLYATKLLLADDVWSVGTLISVDSVKNSAIGFSSVLLDDNYCWVSQSYNSSRYYLTGNVYTFTETSYKLMTSFTLDNIDYYSATYTQTRLAYIDGEDKLPYILIAHGTASWTVCRMIQLDYTMKNISKHYAAHLSAHTAQYVDLTYDFDYNAIVLIGVSNATSTAGLRACVIAKNDNGISIKAYTQIASGSAAGQISAIVKHTNTPFYTVLYSMDDTRTVYYDKFLINPETYTLTTDLKHIVLEQQVRYALDPPFDGIALTGGYGGDDNSHFQPVKVAKIRKIKYPDGFIFPTIWTNVDTNLYTSLEGFILSGTSVSAGTVANAVDGGTGTSWTSAAEGFSDALTIECPHPIKITKMRTYLTCSVPTYFNDAIIEGRTKNGEWIELYKIQKAQNILTDCVLYNTDYYTYYRLTINKLHETYSSVVYEWQATEHEEVIE